MPEPDAALIAAAQAGDRRAPSAMVSACITSPLEQRPERSAEPAAFTGLGATLTALGRWYVTENLLDMGAAACPRRTLALAARDRSAHLAFLLLPNESQGSPKGFGEQFGAALALRERGRNPFSLRRLSCAEIP